MKNPMPTMKHLDVALKSIVGAKSREQAERALESVIEYREQALRLEGRLSE